MGSHRHYLVAFACVAFFAIQAAAGTAPQAGPGADPTPEPKAKVFPLEAWMKANTAAAMAAKDPFALAKALDELATFAPKEYSHWASIARDGAAAARANRIDAVKASCRGCHTQYRARYKLELRDRPIPPPGD
ncbi:hypothetical protein LVJ94_08290 [Pendulispora rubella]|uniref:Cytochrome c n=1 Tax=Pendulispora rubella TaxID=2741070 RepID=A0ABZ2L8M6_9BACT